MSNFEKSAMPAFSRFVRRLLAALLALPLAAAARPAGPKPPQGLDAIRHIVVIYLENHSFDNLYGLFPGADGIGDAPPETRIQTDLQGKPYATLPPVPDDDRFPKDLPNRPFEIGRYAPPDRKIGNATHRYYQHQAQINGGRMDRFVALSGAGGLALGYYDGRSLPLWRYAERYTLADRFFQAAFGGSFLNHLWLACACTPRHPDPPPELTAVLDAQGGLVKDGDLTPDGYAVNTLFPAHGPHPARIDPRELLPPLTQPTLGDRLSEKNITWAWYSGGWNNAVAGRPDPDFQFHHQPYAYFQRYAEGTPERAAHLRDEADFLQDIERGSLPAVAFYKPLGRHNEHPGYADLLTGERWTADILGRIERSPAWPHTVVIVTYDEYGGFWDHVSPPEGDRWGPGSRVPALVISPYARKGFVDHTPYDTTSILRLIETRHGLKPLGERDAGANNLLNALDLPRKLPRKGRK
jgi:phospholipase C